MQRKGQEHSCIHISGVECKTGPPVGAYYEEQNHALEMLITALQKRENECPGTVNPISMQRKMPAPFMAPPHTGHPVIGRDSCLREVKDALLQGDGRAVAALRGLPGVGKTTLAVELAYDVEMRQHFKDGILWAGLGRQPALLTLLSAWAEALGIPANPVDGRASVIERAALLRNRIGMRRMLLVVDDAWQLEAALALKVGGPNCAHLVTTRLPDIAFGFAEGNVFQIHELNSEDGLSLLEAISPRAVAADRDQAQNLVKVAGNLPLALILMGKFLQKRSDNFQTRRVQDALQMLQTASVRLQLDQIHPPFESNPNFPFGTPLTLRAAIGLSDASLDNAAHSALLDLSYFPPKPSTFSEKAALAVTGANPETLDALVDGGLLETVAPDRYTLHQTITDYAALLRMGAPAGERFVHYFSDLVETHTQDFSLLDREINNIFAASELAFDHGHRVAFVRLVLALYPFLETRGWYELADRYLQNACAAVNEMDDRNALAALLGKLGDFEVKRSRFKAAQQWLEKSLILAREAKNRCLEGDNLFNLGLACAYQGQVETAWHHLEQCLRIYRESDNEKGEVYALNALGFALQELGHYLQAKDCLDEALVKSIHIEERRCEGWAHYNLGQVCFSLGEYPQAEEHDEQCLQIYRSLGDQRGEGWIVFEKGRVSRQMGNYRRAGHLFSQALEILSRLGDTMGEGYSLLNLGLIQMDLGYPVEAEAYYHRALEKFLQIDCQTGESQVYHLLGTLFRKNGDFLAAKTLLEKSLRLYSIIPYRRGKCTHLANLALIESHLGCSELALEHANEALRISEEMHAPPTRAYVLTCRGQILIKLFRLEAAEIAFSQALSIVRRLGQTHLVIEPLAGLAAIDFKKGNLARAKIRVDEILTAIENQSVFFGNSDYPIRVDRPNQVILTCFHVLNALKDHREESVLRSGVKYMQTWSANLMENQTRMFLALPENREILEKMG